MAACRRRDAPGAQRRRGSEGELETPGDLRLDRFDRLEAGRLRQFADRFGLVGQGVETSGDEFASQRETVGRPGDYLAPGVAVFWIKAPISLAWAWRLASWLLRNSLCSAKASCGSLA